MALLFSSWIRCCAEPVLALPSWLFARSMSVYVSSVAEIQKDYICSTPTIYTFVLICFLVIGCDNTPGKLMIKWFPIAESIYKKQIGRASRGCRIILCINMREFCCIVSSVGGMNGRAQKNCNQETSHSWEKYFCSVDFIIQKIVHACACCQMKQK